MNRKSYFGLGLGRAVLFFLTVGLALSTGLGWLLRAAPLQEPSFEVNFGADPTTPFRVHAELERWARSHNLLLVPDSPMRNLQDGLARVVQAEGLRFDLKMPPDAGRAWLYLDLVSYRPLGKYEFSRVRWLDVYSNGHLVEVLYQGGGSFLKTPYRIPLDREYAPDGVLHIELRPSPGDGSWAIWDAFVSRYKE